MEVLYVNDTTDQDYTTITLVSDEGYSTGIVIEIE